MKKLLITLLLIGMLIIFINAEEKGPETERSISGDLLRFKVVNTSASTGSQAGFKALNDGDQGISIYVEAITDGGEVYIETDTNDLNFNVPTSKLFDWKINDVSTMTLSSTGLILGSNFVAVDDNEVTDLEGTGLSVSGATLNWGGTDIVKDTHVDWGSGANQINSDDLPEGETNLYNQTHTGDVTGSVALTIASNVVGDSELNFSDITITNLNGTANSLPYINSSGDLAELANGTTGYVLKSNGEGAAPSWSAIPNQTLAQLSDTDITSPSANDILLYDGTDSWDNKTYSQAKLWDTSTDLIVSTTKDIRFGVGETTNNFMIDVDHTAGSMNIKKYNGSAWESMLLIH